LKAESVPQLKNISNKKYEISQEAAEKRRWERQLDYNEDDNLAHQWVKNISSHTAASATSWVSNWDKSILTKTTTIDGKKTEVPQRLPILWLLGVREKEHRDRLNKTDKQYPLPGKQLEELIEEIQAEMLKRRNLKGEVFTETPSFASTDLQKWLAKKLDTKPHEAKIDQSEAQALLRLTGLMAFQIELQQILIDRFLEKEKLNPLDPEVLIPLNFMRRASHATEATMRELQPVMGITNKDDATASTKWKARKLAKIDSRHRYTLINWLKEQQFGGGEIDDLRPLKCLPKYESILALKLSGSTPTQRSQKSAKKTGDPKSATSTTATEKKDGNSH